MLLLSLAVLLISSSHSPAPPQPPPSSYSWMELTLHGDGNSSTPSSSIHPPPALPLASDLLHKGAGGQQQAVYVSLTSISGRLYGIIPTIQSIFAGTVTPTRLFVFLSSEPFLLDQGISETAIRNHEIMNLTRIFPISIILTDNIGPHRKLLPLLARKWEEDCVIVTVDDHELYAPRMLESLLRFYSASNRTAVVALRSRRMGVCSTLPWKLAPYTRKRRGLWPEASPGRREMLTLPTGTGGVLYRPQFFHPAVFSHLLRNATITGDDLLFRLATFMQGVEVVTACILNEKEHSRCSHELLKQVSPRRRLRNNDADKSSLALRDDRRRGKLRGRPRKGRSVLSGGGPDDRKEVSLASRFNAGGGNNLMWSRAVRLLLEMDLLDFHGELQRIAPVERRDCLRYMTQPGEGSSAVGAFVDSVLVSYQGTFISLPTLRPVAF